MARETAAQKREREAAEAAQASQVAEQSAADQGDADKAASGEVVNDDSTAGPNDNTLSSGSVSTTPGDPAGAPVVTEGTGSTDSQVIGTQAGDREGQVSDQSGDLFPPSGVPGESGVKGKDVDASGADGAVGPTVYGDSGPNRDLPNPSEDQSEGRYPSTLLTTAAGPLEPPTDVLRQTDPPEGYDSSSTDHVYANVGGQTVAGETFDALVDENGDTLDVDDVFVDENPGVTFVTVGDHRVCEQFFYPNTHEVASRLLYVPGQRVNRADAERVKQAIRSHEKITQG